MRKPVRKVTYSHRGRNEPRDGRYSQKVAFRPLKEVVYSVYGEKRARQIEHKARKQRESLAGVSNTAPLNVQVRLRAYCMIWELKQKYYKADTPLPYVSKASHKADEDKIKSLEAKIIKGGSDEERAVKAIAEAKEYLEIVAGSRIRDNSKCLVF